MKLLFFDDYKLGVLNGDSVVDVMDLVQDVRWVHPHDLIKGVIENWNTYRPRLEQAASSRSGVPLGSVRVRPPLPRATIVCMAVNYNDGMGGGSGGPPPINGFLKAPNSIIGDGDTMVLPDVPATIFEGEAELAVIIGRRATNVRQDDAESYIFGYTNFVDGSARGLQPEANSFYQMKARDTFAPIGPFIVTADEVADYNNLQVRLWNNGELMQDYSTKDMWHKIPRCIEFVSSVHTLEAGDMIATGTNHRGLNPFMDGDRIEVEVEGLGRLHFNVRDDLKRKWKRETRLQRQEAGLRGTTPQIEGKYAPAPASAS